MDLKVIEQKQLAERYLFGRLTPPEAKFFEQIVRKSPQLAERIGLADALKRNMKLLDETGTEWRERPPRFWHHPGVPLGLAAAFVVATALALGLWSTKRDLEARHAALKEEAARGTLAAPTRTQVFRVRPARPTEATPVIRIGGRTEPTFAELRFGVGHVRGNLFKAVVRRDDGTWWARLDNVLRDSNGDVRVALNSSALAAGTYEVALEAVNLRGEGVPVGRVKLAVSPDR